MMYHAPIQLGKKEIREYNCKHLKVLIVCSSGSATKLNRSSEIIVFFSQFFCTYLLDETNIDGADTNILITSENITDINHNEKIDDPGARNMASIWKAKAKSGSHTEKEESSNNMDINKNGKTGDTMPLDVISEVSRSSHRNDNTKIGNKVKNENKKNLDEISRTSKSSKMNGIAKHLDRLSDVSGTSTYRESLAEDVTYWKTELPPDVLLINEFNAMADAGKFFSSHTNITKYGMV